MKRFRISILFIALLFVSRLSNAQEIRTAVPFLSLAPDAKSSSIGWTGIATNDYGNALSYNFSKLSFSDHSFNVSASYIPLLRSKFTKDISLTYLSGFYHVDDSQSVGISIKYLSFGETQLTDEFGLGLGITKPNDLELLIGYSILLGTNFSIGIGLKYIRSQIVTGIYSGTNFNTGNAIAGDLSFTLTNDLGETAALRWGLVFSNIGSKISYSDNYQEFIPSNLGLGIGFDTPITQDIDFGIFIDLNKPLVPRYNSIDSNRNDIPDNRELPLMRAIIDSFSDAKESEISELKEISINLGVKMTFYQTFSLRTGLINESNIIGGQKILTAGLGFIFNLLDIDFSINFSLNEYIDLNPTMGITFTYNTGFYD